MANEDYRSFQGRVYAGPYDRAVDTQGTTKTVYEYYLSGPGLNGDIEIKASFWDTDPALVKGDLLFLSGKFSTYAGKDKEGNEKTTKTINVNYAFKLAGEELSTGNKNTPSRAPKRTRLASVENDDDDLGF